jgi:hypothetical protein
VCRFHIAAGGKLHADKQFIWRPCPECHQASKHHLLKFGFLLLVRLNLGFYKPSSSFLAPLSGRKKTSARGVSHAQYFTLFLFCFILFLHSSFYQKYKKI